MAKKRKGAEGVGTRGGWADLPEELLARIAEGLQGRVDFLRFCSTCSSWRSSARMLPGGRTFNPALRVPALIVSRDDQTIQKKKKKKKSGYTTEGFAGPLYSFSMCTFYLVRQNRAYRSSHKCWLAWVLDRPFVPGLDMLRVEFLTKPALGYRRKTIPKELNILDVSMSELCKYYIWDGPQVLAWQCSDCFDVVQGEEIRKIALIFSRSVPGEFTAAVLYNLDGKLALLKSSREGIWASIDNYQAGYNDVIDYNGKFYAVHHTGKVLEIGLSSKVIEIASPVENGIGGIQKILVESDGDLLLLDKYIKPSKRDENGAKRANVCFKVYKLNEEHETRKLVEIWSLGDRALFLTSRDCSFSVSAQRLPGCTPNCIYLIEQCDNACQVNGNSRRILQTNIPAVFNLEDGAYKRIKYRYYQRSRRH